MGLHLGGCERKLIDRNMAKIFPKNSVLDLSENLYQDANKAALEGDMGKAADLYFISAEGQNIAGDKLFAARLHCLAFLSKLQDKRYLKDKPNLDYLGRFEQILREEKRYDMLVEGYKQINDALRKSRHFSEISIFYIKEMRARKDFFAKEKRRLLWSLYWLWEITSLFGESPFRLLACILFLSLIQAMVLLPAPIEAMKTIHIAQTNVPIRSFLDYWYLSFSLLFSWDYKMLHPLNAIGFVAIFFRFLSSTLIVTLFINVLIRKMSSR